MKKIILLALSVVVWAEDYYCLLRNMSVEFIDSTIWRDKYAFASGSVYVTEDGYNCEKKEFEKAFLDSNIFLYRNPLKKTLFIYSNDIDTYNEGDVFRDEFLHWQKCGMLKMSYEEADSLVSLYVDAMNNREWESHPGPFFLGISWVPYCYPDEIVKWADEACEAEAPPQSNKSIAVNNAKLVVENSVVHVPQILQGEKYFIFDMNGRILQKGFAEKMIRIEHSPSILKLGDEIPLFLK